MVPVGGTEWTEGSGTWAPPGPVIPSTHPTLPHVSFLKGSTLTAPPRSPQLLGFA